MDPEGSLPYSQVPATCPYPQPDRSNPSAPHPTSSRTIIISSFHLSLGLPSGLFPLGFPTKTLHTSLISPIRTTCPAQLILLGLISRTILGEWYSSLSSSLFSCLLYPGKLDTPSPVLTANCFTSSYNTAAQAQYTVLSWNSTNWTRRVSEKREWIHFVFSSRLSNSFWHLAHTI